MERERVRESKCASGKEKESERDSKRASGYVWETKSNRVESVQASETGCGYTVCVCVSRGI